jgi:hypothetical protein
VLGSAGVVRGAYLGLLGSLIVTLAGAAPACKDHDLQPSTTNAVQIRGALRCLINESAAPAEGPR